MMKLKNKVAGALVLCCMLSADQVAANLIANGGFTANAAGFVDFPSYISYGSNPGAIDHWAFTAISGGNAGIGGSGISAPNPYVFGPSDSQLKNFAFIQNGTAVLSQDLTLQAGQEYRLSFEAASRAGQAALARVQIGDATQTYTTSGDISPLNDVFHLYEYTFTAPVADGQASIQLYNLNAAGDNTVAYTNVELIAIPEPATLGLIGIFGTGMVFIRRRLMM